MSKIFEHTAYLNYHRDLAKAHIDLKHVDNKRIAFISTEVNEFDQYINSNAIHDNVMHMMTVRGKLIDNGGDYWCDEVFGGFVLLVKMEDPNEDYRAKDEAYNKAKSIGMDIIARIKNDSQSCPELLGAFDLNRVTYSMTGVYSSNFVGYAFEYPMKHLPAFEYDESKWV